MSSVYGTLFTSFQSQNNSQEMLEALASKGEGEDNEQTYKAELWK